MKGRDRDVMVSVRSSHEKSHKNADGKPVKLRWPWETLVNSGSDADADNAMSRSVLSYCSLASCLIYAWALPAHPYIT